MSRHGFACTILLAGSLLAIVGCGTSDPPQFKPNALAMLDADLVPEHRQQVTAAVTQLFGTPDEPALSETSELDLELIAAAAGPVRSTKPGEALGLYRQHCAHCHGITGDGLGPTAALLDPYPRDFRQGKFKFKSTYLKYPPTDDDLRRVLRNGVPGTAMPSFKLLGEAQIDALVEYVKYLSQRGQVEQELILYLADELNYDPDAGTTDDLFEPNTDDDDADLLDEVVETIEESWLEVADQVVEPNTEVQPRSERTAAEVEASIIAGRDLFYGTKANCVKCHGNTASGDGQQTDFDDWNKRVVEFAEKTDMLANRLRTAKGEAKPYRQQMLAERSTVVESQLSPRNANPRNLRGGVLRGGRRPIDLYWRIHQGVAGSPMPAHGSPRPGISGTLTDEEIWQLADYVLAMVDSDRMPDETGSMATR